MYFDLTINGHLIPSNDQPTGVSPNVQERLHVLARECILSPLEDGQRPTPEPDDSDYDCAAEALGVVFTDTPKGLRDEAWPKAEFKRAYVAEFLRAELRAAAKLGARQDRMMNALQAAQCWRVTLTVDGPDLIRLAFEDTPDELEAALNEPDPAPVESPEDDVERARR